MFSNATMTNNADIIVVEEEPEQQPSVTADVVEEEEEAEEEEHQPLATEVTNDDGGNANIANNADIIVIKDEDKEEELQQPSATYDDHEYDTYSTFATGYGQVESRYDPWNNHHARRFLVVKLSEKRKMYVVKHVKMESIEVYHNPAGIDFDVSLDSFFGYTPNNAINKRVSLYTGDIRCLEIDTIVNAANESLLGGGGVDGAIHKAAGKSLKKECELLGGCRPGYAKISGGHRLPAKYVIHTVGPRNKDGEILKSCYTNVFSLVREKNIKTIAFPCIATGVFGFPIEEATNIALKTTRDWLEDHHEEVERIIFCVFNEDTKKIYAKLMKLYFPAPTNLTWDGYLPECWNQRKRTRVMSGDWD
ncbi:ADP-ribose glycohydrolase MACROD2-like isoform X1 [Clytia hemisphaerica]